MFSTITSIKDERVLEARELTTAKGRIAANKCLLEGEEALAWALNANVVIEYVFYHDKITESLVIKGLINRQIQCFAVTDGILKKVTDTTYLIPIVGVAQLNKPSDLAAQKPSFLVVLDNVKDLGNIGTIVRSATAFGIHHLFLPDQTTDLFAKKTIDASRGKVFDCTLHRSSTIPSMVHTLKKTGYKIVATSPHASTLQSLVPLGKDPIALVLGNETDGVCDELMKAADVIVQIPMASDIESLNVGVAAGISMYELKIKQVMAMMVESIQGLIGRELSLTVRFSREMLDREVKKLTNLSGKQVVFLLMLRCDEQERLSLLEREMDVSGNEINAWVEALSYQGFIERCMMDNQPAVKITKHGQEFLAKVWPVIERIEKQIVTGFSESELIQLSVFLKRLQKNCGE